MKGQMSEALCRRRHKASYADLFVMPTWQEVRQVGAVSCLERSA
jgi:gentisate 1,2-dioxygenase